MDAMLSTLRQAVATRCCCIDERPPCTTAAAGAPGSQELAPAPLLPPAPVMVLFSGGADSTLLAALAHDALPEGVPIDLACICFDAGASPDRQSALDALRELQAFAPTRQWRLIRVGWVEEAGWQVCHTPCSAARAARARHHRQHQLNPSAALRPVDTLPFACLPLPRAQVDCSLDDVSAARPRLLRLLAPADTVMDLNIGAALWLAARGEGTLLPDADPQQQSAAAAAAADVEAWRQDAAAPPPQAQQAAPGHGTSAGPGAPTGPPLRCRSAARVVLLGHGADELCGGYGRHRTAFRARGWQGLGEELELDLRRLWLRNLGRDDRLVADHGRCGTRVLARLLCGPPSGVVSAL